MQLAAGYSYVRFSPGIPVSHHIHHQISSHEIMFNNSDYLLWDFLQALQCPLISFIRFLPIRLYPIILVTHLWCFSGTPVSFSYIHRTSSFWYSTTQCKVFSRPSSLFQYLTSDLSHIRYMLHLVTHCTSLCGCLVEHWLKITDCVFHAGQVCHVWWII